MRLGARPEEGGGTNRLEEVQRHRDRDSVSQTEEQGVDVTVKKKLKVFIVKCGMV